LTILLQKQGLLDCSIKHIFFPEKRLKLQA